MAGRSAQGLPTPTVSFEFSSDQGSSLSDLDAKKYPPGEGYSYTAKTILHYRGPADAGLQRWPELALSPEHSRRLGVSSEELRARYVAAMDKSRPGFWKRFQLGREPRTYTILESGKATSPRPVVGSAPSASALIGGTAARASAQEDLVFGFSVNVPDIEKSWSFGFQDIEELTFSFDFLNWGIGVRLPVAVDLDSPEPMDEGATYSATSGIQGLNYSGAQYSGAGLPSESGNEVYFRFDLQGCLEFSGIIDSGRQCAGPDIQRARSFVTPFGAGVDVPFPTIDIAVLDYGLAGIDLDLNSSVGSDEITADWAVLGAALGSGHLSYESPTASEALSSIKAIDGPGQALFSIDGLLYHFTQFDVSPRVRLWVDIEIPIPLAPDVEWDDNWSFGLGTYELSDLVDRDFLGSDGASVGVHHTGTGYTGATRLAMDVEVVNVAPTATITLSGGEEIGVNGVPTIFGGTDESFTFTGTARDPGRDDLTLTWDWADGPPVPDQSASYPISGATGPNVATSVQRHVFGRACLYEVTLKAVDDDAAFGEDHASILVTETGKAARLEGFWQHQLGRTGSGLLAPNVLECYLAIAGRVSTIFSEVRAASTLEAAFTVVNIRQNSGSELEQLDREILVAWLNFASGAMGYTQPVDTDLDGVGDTPLNNVLRTAEAVRLAPSSTSTDLRRQIRIVHRVSEQFTSGFGD